MADTHTQFTDATPGTLAAGTVTDHGTIVRSTLTAYEMTDGKFVAFGKVHGRTSYMPLVTFGSWH